MHTTLRRQGSDRLIRPIREPDRPTVVVKRSPIVVGLVGIIAGMTGASTGILVAKRGNANGRVLTHRVRHLSLHDNQRVIGISVKTIDRSLFRDRLFKRRQNTFASTHRDHPKGFRTTRKDALFLSRVKGLPLKLRTGLLTTLRGHRIAHLKDGQGVPISVHLVTTAGHGLPRVITRSLFHRSLFCHVGAVRVRVPPLQGQQRSVTLFISCFLGGCASLCKQPKLVLRPRTLRGLTGCS